MPRSASTRDKKHRPGHYSGNRKIPATPKWILVVKTVGILLLALLMFAAIVGLILKHLRHA